MKTPLLLLALLLSACVVETPEKMVRVRFREQEIRTQECRKETHGRLIPLVTNSYGTSFEKTFEGDDGQTKVAECIWKDSGKLACYPRPCIPGREVMFFKQDTADMTADEFNTRMQFEEGFKDRVESFSILP